jgi:hypothetical protein
MISLVISTLITLFLRKKMPAIRPERKERGGRELVRIDDTILFTHALSLENAIMHALTSLSLNHKENSYHFFSFFFVRKINK